MELRTASWSVPIDTQGTARQEFCLDRNGSEPCVQGYLKGTRPRYCWSASIDTQGTVALHARFAPISIQAELLSGCAPFSWHKCIDPALIAKGSNLWLQSPLVAKEGFCETRRLAAGRMFSALCRWSHELCYYLGGVAVVIWRGGTGGNNNLRHRRCAVVIGGGSSRTVVLWLCALWSLVATC